VIQEMATSTQATHYESAVRAMSQAAAEAELTHAPIRLAYWRIAAMDSLLDRLEELRLAGERAVPEDIRFEAQGRVMLELAELRRVPNWQDLDLTLAPGDDEAA